jgi:hypothetical protein
MNFMDKISNRLMDTLIFTTIVALVFWSIIVPAKLPESIPYREYQDEMRREGQFLTVHLSVGSPTRIFVVGKEEVKIDFSKLKLTVRRLNPYPGKVLKTDRYDNYFVVNDPVDIKKDAEFEINLETNQKTETFNFKLKSKVP